MPEQAVRSARLCGGDNGSKVLNYVWDPTGQKRGRTLRTTAGSNEGTTSGVVRQVEVGGGVEGGSLNKNKN